jgi:DNA polymerase
LLVTALAFAGDDPQKYFKEMKKGPMLAVSKTDGEREDLLNHPDAVVRSLMAARVAVKSWPLHISRVERILNQATANGGVLCVPLRYYGAHTGRWSGTELINLQNLAKAGLLSAIRQLLVAPDGTVLVIVDAAAIEARVLAWIAGEWDLVEKFRTGAEIYCGFASKIVGWTVRKPREGGIKAVEERHKWARNSIGKIGILGGGYGMGTDKFHALGDGAFDKTMAKQIRDTYRAEHPAIVQFWKDAERCFLQTVITRRTHPMDRGLRFDATDDCDVMITLPNGRELKYHRVRVKHEEGPYGWKDTLEVYNAIEHSWNRTWGGEITENVVQALSRDILAECILRLEDQGIHVCFHCHDEVVCTIPPADAPRVLAVAIKEMSVVPTWGQGLALGAEGCISTVYKK